MYIYILRCEDNSLYTGIAVDLEKRIRQHLGIIKGGAKYTRSHPIKYIEAVWFTYSDSDARKMEYKLQHLSHNQKEELIDSPSLLFKFFRDDIADCEFEYIDSVTYNIEFNFMKGQVYDKRNCN